MTQLQDGNRALRSGHPETAVRCYVRALDEAPGLRAFIGANLALARSALLARRAHGTRPRVAICGVDIGRMLALAAVHAEHANVELIHLQRAPAPPADPLTGSGFTCHALACNGERHAAVALEFVVAHVYEAVHVVGLQQLGVAVGLLSRLLWGSHTLADIDGTAAGADAARADPAAYGLGGREWLRIAAEASAHFDAVTSAGDAAPERAAGSSTPATAAALHSVYGAQAAPARPLTAAATRLLEWLPLPQPLHEILPQLLPAAAMPGGGVAPLPLPLPLPLNEILPQLPPAAAMPGGDVAALAATALPSAAPTQAPAGNPRIPPAEAVISPYRPPVTTVPGDAGQAATGWTHAAEFAPDADTDVVELFGAAVGLLAHAAADGGFGVVHAFAAMHGRADARALQLRPGAGSGRSPAATTTAAPGPAPCRWQFRRAGIDVADIWYAGSTLLRLRLRPTAGAAGTQQACVLRAFQLGAGGGPLRALAELPLACASDPCLADVPLSSPLHPLLLLLTTADGHWLETALLPFPSLCRGGLHHAELAAVGSASDPMRNLELLSNALLDELLASDAWSVGRIEADLQGATGSGPLFSRPLREWLADILHIGTVHSITPTDPPSTPVGGVADGPGTAALAGAADGQALRRMQQRDDSGGLVLTLGPDALPTIGILVARGLGLAADRPYGSSTWLVADAVSGRPLGMASLPPPDDALLGLQALGMAHGIPLLRRAAGHPALPASPRAIPPLAIRFAAAAESPATLLQPVAADRPGPLLRRALSDAERGAATISLLFDCVPDAPDPAPLLESLARQTLAAAVEVVIVLPPGAPLPARIESLLLPFAGRSRVVVVDGPAAAERLNAAATQARGAHLLLADATTILHDPRTLETLYTLALAPGLATAACSMLREVAFKKGSQLRRASGGMFPSHLSFRSRPTLVIAEPGTGLALPHATYPVVANAFRLAIVSAAVWSVLGGLDSRAARADLDFCLRALGAGYRHLCTGVVTAADLGAPAGAEHVDPSAWSLMPPQRWCDVLDSVAVIRAFQT